MNFYKIGLIAIACTSWALLCSHVPIIDFSGRSNQIVIDYTKALQEDYRIAITGLGGSMPDDIEKIEIHYDIWGEFDLKSARSLYMKIAKGLLDKINEDIPIRAYLHEYPARLNLLRLSIAFHDDDGRYPENKIAYISFVNSRICYRIHNDDKDSFEVIWRETLEEATHTLGSLK